MSLPELKCTVSLDQLDPVSFRVTAFEVTESLFETYRLSIDAIAREEVDTDALLGKKGTLELARGEEVVRRWHGRIHNIVGQSLGAGGFRVRVELVPRLEQLRLGRNACIFQAKNAKQIVAALLEEGELPSAAVSWELASEPPERIYTVQYGENDLDFARRLLAEEGIGFAVHNGESEEKVLFFDDSTGLPALDGNAALPDRVSTTFEQETVDGLCERRAGASDAAMIRDYDFQRPSFDASSRKEASESTQREVYLHPSPFAGTGDGTRRAERLLERLRSGVKQLSGSSDCPRLEPGRAFEVQNARRARLNGEYVLTTVRHRAQLGDGSDTGAPASYQCEFVAVPKDVPWRPPPVPAPPAHGIEVAFVVCPDGEEIHSDEWGRVKARFPWDRSGAKDDRASCWMRVGQPPMGGSMVLPRGEFEVIIDFERGLADAPFVAGHLYNAEVGPPYALPGGKTRSSFQSATTAGGSGANELRFEDAAGAEEIFFNASKDHTVSVENDHSLGVTQHHKSKVGANATLKVGEVFNAQITGLRKLDVGSMQEMNVGSDYSDTVGGAEKLNVGAVRKRQVGGDLGENVKSTFDRKVGGLLSVTSIRGYGRNVVGNWNAKVGAAWMEVIARNRVSNVEGLRMETVGAVKMVKAKTIGISCGAAYAATAGSEVAKAGEGWSDSAKGAVALTATGGLTVKAKTMTFEAKSSLSVIAGGVQFKLSSSGAVEITAPNIDLKGVKALAQVRHNSN